MASIPSVDRSLARTSAWMSYVAFAGLVALAFLPEHDVPHMVPPHRDAKAAADTAKPAERTQSPVPVKPVQTAAVPAPPTATTPTSPPTVSAATSTPANPAVATAPPPDVWTPEQINAGLRSCLQLLAPAGADIALEEPMKHGQCGTPVPLALRSIGIAEKVEFTPAPTMNCRLAASLAEWIDKVLQPAAQQVLGSRIKRIVGSSSYSCRNIYNNPKLSLSEHATGNAIDIAGFQTVDGRTIYVAKTWGPTGRDIEAAKKKAAEKSSGKAGDKDKSAEKPAEPTPSIEDAGKKASAKDKGKLVKATFKRDDAKPAEAAAAATVPGVPVPATTKEANFLKRVHGGSCTVFATVIGPEANEAHRDHFHLDMKVRSRSGSVCH